MQNESTAEFERHRSLTLELSQREQATRDELATVRDTWCPFPAQRPLSVSRPFSPHDLCGSIA